MDNENNYLKKQLVSALTNLDERFSHVDKLEERHIALLREKEEAVEIETKP